MDCSTALTIKGSSVSGVPANPMAITYAASPATKDYTTGYTSIFANADSTNCVVDSCILMNSACSSPLPTSTNFYIASSSPWAITAKQSIQAGWTQISFCFKCTGSGAGTLAVSKTAPSL